jgi:RNA polymerase sigma-70 factor, ECF subfamily
LIQADLSSTPEVAALDVTELLRKHGRYGGRTLRYLGVSEADLDDALQEVFVIVHRRLSTYEPRMRFEAWLRVICVNVARNHLRGARRRPTVPLDTAPETTLDAPQEETVERRQMRTQLLRLLEALPGEQREIVVLVDIEEMPMREVAEALDCPVKTAYSRLYAGRASLRAALLSERTS